MPLTTQRPSSVQPRMIAPDPGVRGPAFRDRWRRDQPVEVRVGDEALFLSQQVFLEPLVDRWCAWSHLISPATAAMNIVGRHLQIMESYVASPMIHAAANSNPDLRGGPFLDHGGGRVEEIRALIEQTRRERAALIELHSALLALEQLLEREASGGALEPLYERVPECLRGYVELVYDLHNRPSARLLEALMYRGPLMDTSTQSVILRLDTSPRPFTMSTPRLDEPDQLHLVLPFADRRIDALVRLRWHARPAAEIADVLSLDGEQAKLLSRFLTPEPPPTYDPPSAARCRYLGHACLLIEGPGTTVLFDPAVSHGAGRDGSFTIADLPPRIDYLIVTHAHNDHVLIESLLELRHRVGVVVVPRSSGGSLQDPSLALMLRHLGFPDVRELGELDVIEADDLTITAIPFLGEHGDLDVRSKSAYVVQTTGRTLMIAADSRNVEPRMYEHLRTIVGKIDTLFLGMECDGAPMSWVYGPLFTATLPRGIDQQRRLAGSDRERASAMVEALGCSEVYVYAMGLEPWLSHVMATNYTPESNPIVQSRSLIERCRASGLRSALLEGRHEWAL